MDRPVKQEIVRLVNKWYNPEMPMKVLDVGSYDVNGTVKEVLPKHWEYLGMDIVPGPNVDIVVNNKTFPITTESMDLVISTSCFQYVTNPFRLAKSLYKCLRPGGMIFICAAHNERDGLIGLPKELCPNEDTTFDCWRFLKDGMRAVLEEAEFTVEDVYYRDRRSNWWGVRTK